MEGVVTILFTDLVGSTTLLGQLGDELADEIRRAHFAELRGALATHGGREIKNIGDSLMAAFASPAAAVACSVEMQQRVHAHARSGGPALALRVGANAGEATAEDGDYFGTAVVVARRLCDSADGGQVLVSEVVRALVGSRGGFTFKSLGSLPLKGIEDPVPACQVHWEPADDNVPLPAAIAGDRSVLVGRDAERETLRRALARTLEGSGPALLLVAGEPGIGKTTLAFASARGAHAAGAVVLYGRCEEGLGIPYQPFVEAIRHLARHRADVLAGVDVSRLAPSTTDAPGALAGDAEADRYRLFEAIRAAIGAAGSATGSGAGMVLVVDDLHWADKPTLLLLRHILRAGDGAPLLVIGTYRDVEVDRSHPFAEALGELRRDPGYERILLRGLSEEGVASYLEQRAGHSLDASGRALATALHRETEGNPFFIREIIRHLVESGAIYERDGRWVSDRSIEDVGLPESVREVIGRRLNRLGDECAHVLSVASVIGRDFDLRLLARVAELEEDRLADLLDEAVAARGVIEEMPDVLDRYSFAHALIRETLYEELSTSRRVRLHRRIGEGIEDLYSDDLGPHLAELAHHFQEASVAGVEGKAVDYSRRAAARAVQQLAFEEAAAHVDRALQTLDAMDEPDPEVLCETLIAGADVHQRMTGFREARRLGARSAEIARAHRWPERLARAALAYGGVWIDIGLTDEELVAMLHEAIDALPEQHPLIPLLEGRLAMDLFSGDPADLDARSRRAVEAARRLGDPRTLAYALIARRHAVSGPARLRERLALSGEAIDLARATGDAHLEMRARAFRIVEQVESADADGARQDEDDFLRLAREYREPFYLRYMSTFIRAGLAIREGRFPEADEALAALTEGAREQGRLTAVVANSAQRLLLQHFRGQPLDEDALDILLRFASMVAWSAPNSAWLLLRAGKLDEARATWFGEGRRWIEEPVDDWAMLQSLAYATEMAEAFADRDSAAVIAERLAPYSGWLVVLAGTALVSVYGAVDDFLGRCRELLGQLGSAIEHYRAAAATHERWGMRPFLTMTRMHLARALASRAAPGDAAEARKLLDTALADADEIGLRLGVPEARALRATLGD